MEKYLFQQISDYLFRLNATACEFYGDKLDSTWAIDKRFIPYIAFLRCDRVFVCIVMKL